MKEECQCLNESEISNSSTLKTMTMLWTLITLTTIGKSAIHTSSHMGEAGLLILGTVMTD
jgi:hypothetical protein